MKRVSGFLPLGLLFALMLWPGAVVQSEVSSNWAIWDKRPDPIFTGQFIASDPSIVFDDDIYRMTYTCFVLDPSIVFDPALVRAAICEATSADGFTWTEVPVEGPIQGLVVQGRAGEWDENLEGSELVKSEDEFRLFFSGYRQIGDPVMGFPAALEMATSTDGLEFTRLGTDPVVSPSKGGYDNDAVYSPSIIQVGTEWIMIYAGHCYSECDEPPGVRLLAATSADGISWTKRPTPVLESVPDLPWTADGVAEPALVQGSDGQYYLFFSGLQEEDRSIGVGVSDTPFGPWDLNPEPVIVQSHDQGAFDESGVLAPFVRIEGDKTRMWFLGSTPEEAIAIGYAEAPWPLKISE